MKCLSADIALPARTSCGPRLPSGPMAEPIRRARRPWKTMDDSEVLVLAMELIGKERMTDFSELWKADQPLANEIKKRGLGGMTGLRVQRCRKWKDKSDDELAGIVNDFVGKNRIRTKRALWDADAGLADRVRERGLWDRIAFHEGSAHETAVARRTGCQAKKDGDGAGRKPDAGGPAALDARPAAVEKQDKGIWTEDEITFLAQSMIDEMEIADMGELETFDGELHRMVVDMGLEGKLGFHERKESGDAQRPDAVEGAGEGVAGCRAALSAGASAEQVRKLGLQENGFDEGLMFRLICAECFRMGSAAPFVGGRRTTLEKLRSGLQRKLSGRQQRLFRRCWDRMASEGAISFNSNRTAASLNPLLSQLGEGPLRDAIAWAVREQMSVDGRWEARYGAMLNP
jgi:hypothetical protein